jgi:hypothetical protein
VAPGPGFLVIALGLFVLSLEYEWARRHLEKVRKKVADLADLAVAKPWSTVGSILCALGLVGGGVVVGMSDRLPASGWWTGGSLIAGGVLALATILVSLEQARRARKAGSSPGVATGRPAATSAPMPTPQPRSPSPADEITPT